MRKRRRRKYNRAKDRPGIDSEAFIIKFDSEAFKNDTILPIDVSHIDNSGWIGPTDPYPSAWQQYLHNKLPNLPNDSPTDKIIEDAFNGKFAYGMYENSNNTKEKPTKLKQLLKWLLNLRNLLK